MKFFQTIKDSIYNPQFYKGIRDQKASVSVKYFAKLAFVIACVVAIIPIVGGVGLLTWKHNEIDNIHSQIRDVFPQELVVDVKNGEVSTNMEEPYAIALPESIKKEISSEGMLYTLNNLLVIDTSKSIEMSDFQMHETLLIVGKHEIGVLNPEKNEMTLRSLEGSAVTYTLNRTSFEIVVDMIWRVVKVIAIIILVLLPFLIFAGIFVGYSAYLVFGALAVWLASNITNQSLTYGQSYKTGLHLITLPLILSFALPPLFHAPFLFTLVLLAVAYVNFKSSVKPESETTMQKEDELVSNVLESPLLSEKSDDAENVDSLAEAKSVKKE
jgi:hypothetical protein